MKTITFDNGKTVSVQDETRTLSVYPHGINHIGEVMSVKVYDVSGDKPVFIKEYQHTVTDEDYTEYLEGLSDNAFKYHIAKSLAKDGYLCNLEHGV